MSVPSKRVLGGLAAVILALMVVREWNIRRHVDSLENWPRVGPGVAEH